MPIDHHPHTNIDFSSIIMSCGHVVITFLRSLGGSLNLFSLLPSIALQTGVLNSCPSSQFHRCDYIHQVTWRLSTSSLNIRRCGLGADASKNVYGRVGGAWVDEIYETSLENAANSLLHCIEDDNIKGGKILQILEGKPEPLALKRALLPFSRKVESLEEMYKIEKKVEREGSIRLLKEEEVVKPFS
jgi:hypothetical protein